MNELPISNLTDRERQVLHSLDVIKPTWGMSKQIASLIDCNKTYVTEILGRLVAWGYVRKVKLGIYEVIK
jgi:hypothetical protein